MNHPISASARAVAVQLGHGPAIRIRPAPPYAVPALGPAPLLGLTNAGMDGHARLRLSLVDEPGPFSRAIEDFCLPVKTHTDISRALAPPADCAPTRAR